MCFWLNAVFNLRILLQDVWQKAIVARKTLITIDHVTSWKKDVLKKLIDNSGAKTFTGVLNEKHMMAVVSADLCLEDKSGWTSPPTGKVPAQCDWFKERCKAALDLTANNENVLSFMFDGRSREAYRMSHVFAFIAGPR